MMPSDPDPRSRGLEVVRRFDLNPPVGCAM